MVQALDNRTVKVAFNPSGKLSARVTIWRESGKQLTWPGAWRWWPRMGTGAGSLTLPSSERTVIPRITPEPAAA